MIKLFNKNKILFFLIISIILVFIISLILYFTVDKKYILDINNRIISYIKNTSSVKFNLKSLYKNLFNNISYNFIIWFLGVSIIGIFFLLFLFYLNCFVSLFEIISLFSYYKFSNILFTITYSLYNIVNLVIITIIYYYAITYSIILFKYLFLKKDYSIQVITRRYLKILIFLLIYSFIQSIIDIYLFPNLIRFIIT
ncbi:MAG: hypothetical protein IJ842_04950 [Bacilli bacterium]|nr:hypothetical protein [Bacilli bacterium]